MVNSLLDLEFGERPGESSPKNSASAGLLPVLHPTHHSFSPLTPHSPSIMPRAGINHRLGRGRIGYIRGVWNESSSDSDSEYSDSEIGAIYSPQRALSSLSSVSLPSSPPQVQAANLESDSDSISNISSDDFNPGSPESVYADIDIPDTPASPSNNSSSSEDSTGLIIDNSSSDGNAAPAPNNDADAVDNSDSDTEDFFGSSFRFGISSNPTPPTPPRRSTPPAISLSSPAHDVITDSDDDLLSFSPSTSPLQGSNSNQSNIITDSDDDISSNNFSPQSSPPVRLHSPTDSDFALLGSPPGAGSSSANQTIGSSVSNSGSDIARIFFGQFGRNFGFSENLDSAAGSSSSVQTVQTASTSTSTSTKNQPTSATASSSSAATMNQATGGNTNSVSFECSVCLEGLDGPASIDPDVQPSSSDDQNSNNDAYLQYLPQILLSRAGGAVPTARRGARMSVAGGRPGRPVISPRQQAKGTVNDENASLTDVVATACGHLYHQVCLLKWFRQQGRRTCPSCRKMVPKTKLIRLYPSLSASSGDGNRDTVNQMPPPVNVGTTNANAADPSTSTSTGGCFNASCRDMKDIHNTLITDYTDLQERYNDLRDNDALKDAQISSLEEDNTRKENEIAQLKRELEGSREGGAASASSSAKRRRR